MQYVGLSVAGPRSRDLLQSLVDADLSSAAFPFLSFRQLDVGMVPALVGRISFTGDLGYEIWVDQRLSARAVRSADTGGR